MLSAAELTLFRNSQPVVKNLSFSLKTPGLLAIIGPNGSGKSTLLEFLFAPKVISHHGAYQLPFSGQERGYLPQSSRMNRTFPLRVKDAVGTGIWPTLKIWQGLPHTLQEKRKVALEEMGLWDLRNRSLTDLSGGQFQRVLFARLILQDKKFLLLDEPLNGLDHQTQIVLLEKVVAWAQQGRTVLMTLHNDALVRDYFPQALCLKAEGGTFGPTEDVLSEACCTQPSPSVPEKNI